MTTSATMFATITSNFLSSVFSSAGHPPKHFRRSTLPYSQQCRFFWKFFRRSSVSALFNVHSGNGSRAQSAAPTPRIPLPQPMSRTSSPLVNRLLQQLETQPRCRIGCLSRSWMTVDLQNAPAPCIVQLLPRRFYNNPVANRYRMKNCFQLFAQSSSFISSSKNCGVPQGRLRLLHFSPPQSHPLPPRCFSHKGDGRRPGETFSTFSPT